jgi:SecD/SecF fusion protein
MKSKGAIKLFSILLTVICAYQLTFTWKTNSVENEAKEFGNGDKAKERYYLDSIAREKVWLGFTYLECKERELNLGLDLQGGMNVTLEVSLAEMVRSLSGNNPDAAFNKAIETANERLKTSQKDYVTLFGEAYAELAPSGKLSGLFATKENKDRITLSSTNEEVLKFISEEANQAIDRSFQILRARIDKFGVTQPNIQKLGSSGRILVELPGVDNPERVRKLLQGSARLQFWETYDNNEALPFIQTANSTIAKMQGVITEETKNDSTSVASTDSTTTASADTTQKEELSLLKSSAASTDSSKNLTAAADSAKQDTSKQKSEAEFRRENPLLFTLLFPSIDDKQNLVKGPVVGSALIRDTAKINSYLSMPEVASAMPSTIKFLWAAKAFDEKEERLALYAIRVSKDGGAALEGDVITDARRDVSQSGSIEISMSMNTEGARVWKSLTGKSIGKSVAIVLDDRVYSAPTVQSEIPNGRSSINGSFTNEEAIDLANILKSGKLPAPTRIVEEAIVGPSLGQEAISQGLLSMVASFIIIILFMIAYYGKSGMISDLAVFANVFFILGVLASYGAALTLPGIAGIVLTIGMAVDANVLINERVKEELSLGKSLRNAITDGYKNANSSIVDGNLTTLIAGIALMVFGTGPVQGFAVTLIIGIISSMFTAVLLTRIFMEWNLDRNKPISFVTNMSRNFFKNVNFDFVGNRFKYYAFSSIIILGGIISLATKGLTLGVDFKGGWTYVVQFEQPISSGDIAEALKKDIPASVEVKTFGTDNKYKITTSYLIDEQSADASEKVEAKVLGGVKVLDSKAEMLSSAKVGPTIANDIRNASIIAVLVSLFGIGLYILIRFRKWQYALGAIIALAHDVMMMVSFYSIFDGVLPFTMEVDQAFIAAVLTIIGFSINDTVVVFDRVREYLSHHKLATDKKAVINNALNSTLNRTVITSLTVFMVCLVLFLFGGEIIKGFTFALLVGVVFGTISSIGIATPIVIDFDKYIKKED